MKKLLSLLVVLVLALAGIAVPAGAEETEPEPERHTSGDFAYVILEDGTAEIVWYYGEAEELEIPEKLDSLLVTGIEDIAFEYNSEIKSVTIPDCVTRVGINPFWNCASLKDIRVSPEHPYLATIDGVLFSKPDKRLICYPCAFEDETYTIPDGIQIIGDFAFFGCNFLKSVDIPGSVASIEAWAFSSCSSLTSIDIPDSVTEVERNPFRGCDSLKDIRVSPEHPYLATINGVLFSKPDKRLICYPCAFEDETYTIPDGIRIIGEAAFFDSESLKSIDIPDSVTRIGYIAFSGCPSLKSIDIPDGVTSIEDWVFSGCSSLTSIDIPDSVISIGNNAFSGCSSLTSIDVPDSVISIGNNAFSDCSSLTSIVIPDSVISIGESAFRRCYSLTSINIPDSVTSIGYDAFSGCESAIFTVPWDSYAERYCKENGIKYFYPESLDWLNN